MAVYVGSPVPPPLPLPPVLSRGRSLGSEVRKLLSRRRSASVSRLIQRLSRHCSRRLVGGIPDPTVSYTDRSAAKWRPRFRRKKRSEHRERLRSERNENDHSRCCTSHGWRSYQNPTASQVKFYLGDSGFVKRYIVASPHSPRRSTAKTGDS